MTLAEVFNLANTIANIGIVVALPFILWILANLQRDVREIKSVNLVRMVENMGEMRVRLTAVETRNNIKDRRNEA